MVAGFLLAPWALSAMGTTQDAMPGAVLYLRVYFLGMIPNVVYNMGTGVLRAIGDFRRPLYFLIAASVCNIVLDLLLVLVFHLDVAGVAIATICSQLLSAVLVVIALMRSQGAAYQLEPRQLRIYRGPMELILRIGVPSALQSVMYSASNIVIQSAINSFGTDTVAAWTAYGKMDVLFWMTVTAMAQSVTTFAGQNYGAGQYGRMKRGLWVSAGVLGLFTVAISAVFFFLARPILTIFTPDPPPCWRSAWKWSDSWPPATSPTSSSSCSPASSGGRASPWCPCSSTYSGCAGCGFCGCSPWCLSTTPCPWSWPAIPSPGRSPPRPCCSITASGSGCPLPSPLHSPGLRPSKKR